MLEPQYALRDRLRRELEDLQKKLEGVEMAIRAGEGDEPTIISTAPKRRASNVKQTLMQLLEEVGNSGLNAISAVEMASRRNENIERATASSLLSRLKADDLVTYDGKVYRLKKFGNGSSTGAPMH